MSDVTHLLPRWRDRDRDAFEDLFGLLYAELRRMARHRLNGERAEYTLQGTALVHEVYRRLVVQEGISWQNRGRFMAVAAQAMRRVLVDHSLSRSPIAVGKDWTVARASLDRELQPAAATPAPR